MKPEDIKSKGIKSEDIKKVVLKVGDTQRGAVSMLEGEIPGATVFHHVMSKGDAVVFAPGAFMRILFLCSGAAAFTAGEKTWVYDEKAVFVPGHIQEVEVEAQKDLQLLEVRWELHEGDMEELRDWEARFPFAAKYADALQYRDPFKSEKTISRAILPQRTIPRFAMGSVETYGDDLIGQHEHPLLDQFFFSFPENDMELLLEDISYPMGGNTLLHIPLGCNHGVSVKGAQCAHYIWIDFIIDEKGIAYLDEVHKETGTKREF